MRTETYLKILEMLEGKVIWLSWHQQIIINKSLLNFEKTLWSSATGLWQNTGIFSKRMFSVWTTKSIQTTTNNNKLNIHISTYEIHKIICCPYLWITSIVFQDWISRNQYFQIVIWIITLTDLSTNLIRHERFETQTGHILEIYWPDNAFCWKKGPQNFTSSLFNPFCKCFVSK